MINETEKISGQFIYFFKVFDLNFPHSIICLSDKDIH